jgi:hypothetical protein
MLRPVIAVLVAIVALALAVVAYFVVWILLCWLEGPRLIASLILLAISIYSFRRLHGIPTLLLLLGSIGLAGAHLHDYFISFGIEHELFQFGGADTYIMQGFFEPRENPLIAVPADLLRFTGLLTFVGIVWLTFQFTQKHLTRRCSERLVASAPHLL